MIGESSLRGQPLWINERDVVVGACENGSIDPLANFPEIDAVVWKNGLIINLGTLGGNTSQASSINNRGWDKKNGMKDLGTLGGSNGQATWLNDAGEVVGVANLPGDTAHDAFLWKGGVMTDLGNLGVTSFAWAINSGEQIAGNSRVNSTTVRPFLWENGGPMIDLNSLVLPGSGLTALNAQFINERGEIVGTGQLANGDVHAMLLIPCDEKHPGECEDYSMIEAPASQTRASTAEVSAPTTGRNESPEETVNPSRNRFGRGAHMSGQPVAPRD